MKYLPSIDRRNADSVCDLYYQFFGSIFCHMIEYSDKNCNSKITANQSV